METKDVTDDEFGSEVLENDLPVIVDFWAEWCGPCRALGPMIEEIASDYEGMLKVVKVDVDRNVKTAMAYEVLSIPTVISFKGGNVVARAVGAIPKEEVISRLKIEELIQGD